MKVRCSRFPLPPISPPFITRWVGTTRAGRTAFSRLLLAFEFGSCSEPEFVASTDRPARMVPQLIGLFADLLFIHVHVMFFPLQQMAVASQTEANGSHQRSSRVGANISLSKWVDLPSTVCRARQVLRLRREANVWRTYNAGLRHRGLQFVTADEPSAGFRHVGNAVASAALPRINA
jgi:hypothetical protein